MLGDQNHPKRVGWFRLYLTSIWCETSLTININIFLCDRPCLCRFSFGRVFDKTHYSSGDLEESWIFDWNHPVSRYMTGVEIRENILTRHKFSNLPNSVFPLGMTMVQVKGETLTFSFLDRQKMGFLHLKQGKLTLLEKINNSLKVSKVVHFTYFFLCTCSMYSHF